MNSIVAEKLSIGYTIPILTDIFFKLGNGIHVLLGANGSGKTTLLKTIAGLIKPLNGKILVNNLEPYILKRKDAAKIIGYTWQNPYYGFIEARVIDEIKFILKTTGLEGDWEIVEILVDKSLYDRDPYTLSGGEAKRVSLASVLVADQPIWLLDEPFNELDYEGTLRLIEIIKRARKKNKLVIISTHLVTLIDNVKPDKYLLIKRNKELEIGDWKELDDDKLSNAGVLTRRIICGNHS
ncbi:MAG: ABC transporter ATP-binding protein [Staphylothermus sp.]|nr:ABC transporter ATP-binding protein [Staphylothermus sp.]